MIEPKHITKGAAVRAAGQVVPFPAPATLRRPETSGLSFTWEALEQQLADLAVTPTQKSLASTLVSATRKQAAFKPADLILREVLCLASVLMDETFHPDPNNPALKEGEMT